MASTSSSTSLSTHSFEHRVFLSFNGEDTRYGFISHLHSALSRKSIITFIDYELKRGEEISQGLLKAIEESMFAVVVFSKGYAFSRWCLDELAKIVECIDNRRQKVIPVFYHVDPSDVRNQTGTFAEAFVGHEAKFNSDTEKLQRWRAALTKAANQSGWATENCRSESAIVDEIVNCIREDLQKMLPSPLKGLVGIVPHIEQLQSSLFGHGSSSSVLILGLWGMGGIGKTTITKALYGQIKYLFERHYFLADVRGEAEKHRLEILRERLFNGLSGEKIKTSSMPDIDQFFCMFSGTKVLVVLDDVDHRKQLESLIGDVDCYGPGSIIIVTSRDQQLLKNFVRVLYKVEPLLPPDALQLFSLHAFKDNGPTDELRKLSSLVVDYAKGVPLALEVLGSSLFEKGKGEWESTVEKLKNAPNKEIQDVLRISYSSLDKKEKEIFLWIAFCLEGREKDFVIEFLNGCGFSTKSGLNVLVDKSLITMDPCEENEIGMHDLLQEMGREIVREESEDPGERSLLWNQEDIYQVFRRNSGNKRIKGIRLNTYGRREVQLHPDTFGKMPNLKFLKIEEVNEKGWRRLGNCKVRLPRGISALPDELRYLVWEGYPSESLPANFNPENLIELQLPGSKITELFCDEMPDPVKLISLDLWGSKQLCKISNLSRARNVRRLNLGGSDSLCEVSSFICHLGQVTWINLSDCPKLRSLPDLVDLKSLESLYLVGCSNLETFPKVPRSIKSLDLSGTAIKEVPSASVKYLDNLVWLTMANCSQLESFPSNVDLKSLKYLCFSGCSLLKKFPEVSKNLECLLLDETAITEVPSSVECLSKLSFLSLKGCTELRILPSTLHFLTGLTLNGCSNLTEFPQPIEEEQEENSLGCLGWLDLSGCNLLPTDLGRLSSLIQLDLRGNSLKTIPSIKQLSLLKRLTARAFSPCQNFHHV